MEHNTMVRHGHLSLFESADGRLAHGPRALGGASLDTLKGVAATLSTGQRFSRFGQGETRRWAWCSLRHAVG